jgi:phosphoribosylanthranilate isomerase
MATAVKICGLTRPGDVEAAVGAGADYVGAILVAASRRSVAPDALAGLFAAATGRAKRVAVTVDPDDDLLDRLLASGSVDLVQLHGHESAERIGAVRQRTGLGVIKALPVAAANRPARASGATLRLEAGTRIAPT